MGFDMAKAMAAGAWKFRLSFSPPTDALLTPRKRRGPTARVSLLILMIPLVVLFLYVTASSYKSAKKVVSPFRADKAWGTSSDKKFSISVEERKKLSPDSKFLRRPGQASEGPLKVYLYDLPAKFNWDIFEDMRKRISNDRDLLPLSQLIPSSKKSRGSKKPETRRLLSLPASWGGNVPVYPGGMAVRTHSVEYYLLLSLLQEEPLPSVQLVADPELAEVLFVPFFSSISVNTYGGGKASVMSWSEGNITKDDQLQVELLEYLKGHEAWKATGGANHVIPGHHPNSLGYLAHQLPDAHFIVSDFQKFPLEVANWEKDIVAPYVSMVEPFESEHDGWDTRPRLAFFVGRIMRHNDGLMRQRMMDLMGYRPKIVIKDQRAGWENLKEAQEGYRKSRFCFMLAGDTPSSCRLFDAILSNCVPVILSDNLELPFEDVLDYVEAAMVAPFLAAAPPWRERGNGPHLWKMLRNVTREEWEIRQAQVKRIKKSFMYSFPAEEGGAEDMVWKTLARRVRGDTFQGYRHKRLDIVNSILKQITGGRKIPIPKGKASLRSKRLAAREQASYGREAGAGKKKRKEATSSNP